MNITTQPHKIVGYGFREVLSLTMRLGEKLKDKYIWTQEDIEEAKALLVYFRDNLRSANKKEAYMTIFGAGEIFSLEPFKRGYNAKSLTFKTLINNELKKWVFKIGHRISPVVDYGDPSTYTYYKQQLRHITILREYGEKHKLPYLIPEPQELLWADMTIEGRSVQTTLAIQPFMNIVNPAKLKNDLTKEQIRALLTEFNAFKKLCDDSINKHKLRPDLLGEGNLEIARIGDDYHLVLLDMGLVDMNAPLPFTQTIMHLASLQTLAKWEGLLRE